MIVTIVAAAVIDMDIEQRLLARKKIGFVVEVVAVGTDQG